jgi:hypothetical protein
MDRQDVGVLEPRSGAGLALEALDHPSGPGDVGAQHLHRETLLQLLVPDLVYLGEATLADEAAYVVFLAKRLG